MDDLIRIKETYLGDIRLYDPSGDEPSAKIIAQKTEQVNTAFNRLIQADASLEKLKAIKVKQYMTSKLNKAACFRRLKRMK